MTNIPKQWIDLLKGLVRTGVPVGVAALVGWLRQRGVDWIPEWGGTYLIPVVTGIGYWVLVRLGELKLSPKWGVFLLAVGGPVYETAAGALNEHTEPVLLELPKDRDTTVEYHDGGVVTSSGPLGGTLEQPPPYVMPSDTVGVLRTGHGMRVTGTGVDAQELAASMAPPDDPNLYDPEGPKEAGELPDWFHPDFRDE